MISEACLISREACSGERAFPQRHHGLIKEFSQCWRRWLLFLRSGRGASGFHCRDVETARANFFEDFRFHCLGSFLVAVLLRRAFTGMTDENPPFAATFVFFAN